MTSKKVPLVVYVDGKRKIIGSATVEAEGKNIAIIGTVIDNNYVGMISPNLSQVSVGTSKIEKE